MTKSGIQLTKLIQMLSVSLLFCYLIKFLTLINNIKKMENHLYNVNINWSQDRKGVMCSPELTQNNDNCLEVATPPEFPKGIPGIWSPEHLFTAAVSSCLMTTFLAVAENFKLDFINFSCESKGMLGKADKGLQMTEVELHPVVTIPDESQRELALKVLNKSERACLITNSIKSSVVMKPQIEIKKK